MTDEWKKKLWYICIMEYYSTINDEFSPFATIWMKLQGFLLTEICQMEDKYWVIYSYVLYKEKMNKYSLELSQQNLHYQVRMA